MSSVFTDYARLLASGDLPDSASYSAICKSLRGPLVHKLRTRGLWDAPPSYLGVLGGTSWEQDDLLDELVSDCYIYIFVRRLPGLLRQLRIRSNIDGLVFRNIQNFLHDRQKKNDPLGFRVFVVLESALQQAVDARRLFILENGPKIRNDTVFGFNPWTQPGSIPSIGFGPHISRWNDDLMPDLIWARGKSRKKIESSLQDYVANLSDKGIEGFRFRDLIDPMKSDIRLRSSILLREQSSSSSEEGEDLFTFIPPVLPDADIATRQGFQALTHCLEQKIGQQKGQKKTRDRLRLLLALIMGRAQSGERTTLSNLAIASLLDFPKDSVRGLQRRLRGLADDCWQVVFGQVPVRGSRGLSFPTTKSLADQEGHVHMNPQNHAEQQRRQTAEAAARFLQKENEVQRSTQPPTLGDIFLFRETASYGVEWLVVEAALQNEERLLVVPVDDNALIGSRDVETWDGVGSPLSIRCDFGVWLGLEAFDLEMRTGSVPSEVLGEVQQKRAAISAEAVEGTVLEEETDDDPAYEEWMAEVLGPAREVLSGMSTAEHPKPQRTTWHSFRWATLSSPIGLAALILFLVSGGLLGSFVTQQHKIGTLESDLSQAEQNRAQLQRDLERAEQDRQSLQRQTTDQRQQIAKLEREQERFDQTIATLQQRLEHALHRDPIELEPDPDPDFLALFQLPQLDLPFVHFHGLPAVRGPDRPKIIPATARRIALVLEVVDPEPYPRYRLEIRREDSKELIWADDELTRPESELSLDLPVSLFSTGSYLLRVYGLSGSEAVFLQVDRLPLEIQELGAS